MKRIICVIVSFALFFACTCGAYASDSVEIVAYDDSAELLELPGYFDYDLDRFVYYSELTDTYSITAIAYGNYLIVGAIVLISLGYSWDVATGSSGSRALAKMVSNVCDNVSSGVQEFCSTIGQMFIEGKEIAADFLQDGADYIAELYNALNAEIITQNDTYSYVAGTEASLIYTIDSASYTLLHGSSISFSTASNAMLYPWNVASAVGAKYYGGARYSTNTTYTYFWHGIGSDSYGEFWYIFSSNSMYGYSTDSISQDSIISVPSDVELQKFYFSSAAAYNAAIASSSTCYFLTSSSEIGSYKSSTSSSSYTFYGVVGCGQYSAAGALTEGVNTAITGRSYAFYSGWVLSSADVSINITVTDTESTYSTIPDGLVLDDATTEAEIDYDALAYKIADILDSRYAGTEASDAEKEAEQSLLQSISDGITALPELIGDVIGSLSDSVVAEVESLAPVQLIQDKVASISLIYETFAAFLGKITTNVEPPVIYVDMTKSDSKIITSDDDKIPILDMSFYEPYKPYGDVIISGVLWTFFLWRLFSRLPDIISGAGMVAESGLSLEDRKASVKDRREKRSKKGG